MKVALPVGQYHQGNTSDYVKLALEALGHETTIVSQDVFIDSFPKCTYDLYFCVDSGEPLNLLHPVFNQKDLSSICFWYIDYRHNKDRPSRLPNDRDNAKFLSDGGGWIFQAQYEDFLDAKACGIERTSWLPLAADPDIWSDTPKPESKIFDVTFVGHVWDEVRATALTQIHRTGFRLGLAEPGKLWKEKASKVLRQGQIGFNISTLFGTAVAFDINMRVFETLSTGTPLLTNWVPSLERLIPKDATFIRTYKTIDEIIPLLRACLIDPHFRKSGAAARKWICDHATYKHRMVEALRTLAQHSRSTKTDHL